MYLKYKHSVKSLVKWHKKCSPSVISSISISQKTDCCPPYCLCIRLQHVSLCCDMFEVGTRLLNYFPLCLSHILSFSLSADDEGLLFCEYAERSMFHCFSVILTDSAPGYKSCVDGQTQTLSEWTLGTDTHSLKTQVRQQKIHSHPTLLFPPKDPFHLLVLQKHFIPLFRHQIQCIVVVSPCHFFIHFSQSLISEVFNSYINILSFNSLLIILPQAPCLPVEKKRLPPRPTARQPRPRSPRWAWCPTG